MVRSLSILATCLLLGVFASLLHAGWIYPSWPDFVQYGENAHITVNYDDLSPGNYQAQLFRDVNIVEDTVNDNVGSDGLFEGVLDGVPHPASPDYTCEIRTVASPPVQIDSVEIEITGGLSEPVED